MTNKETTQGNETMTSTQLTTAFLRNTIVKHMGSQWTIEGLMREDGSGQCFILTLQDIKTGERKDTFIRTQDGIGHPKHTLTS